MFPLLSIGSSSFSFLTQTTLNRQRSKLVIIIAFSARSEKNSMNKIDPGTWIKDNEAHFLKNPHVQHYHEAPIKSSSNSNTLLHRDKIHFG